MSHSNPWLDKQGNCCGIREAQNSADVWSRPRLAEDEAEAEAGTRKMLLLNMLQLHAEKEEGSNVNKGKGRPF